MSRGVKIRNFDKIRPIIERRLVLVSTLYTQSFIRGQRKSTYCYHDQSALLYDRFTTITVSLAPLYEIDTTLYTWTMDTRLL